MIICEFFDYCPESFIMFFVTELLGILVGCVSLLVGLILISEIWIYIRDHIWSSKLYQNLEQKYDQIRRRQIEKMDRKKLLQLHQEEYYRYSRHVTKTLGKKPGKQITIGLIQILGSCSPEEERWYLHCDTKMALSLRIQQIKGVKKTLRQLAKSRKTSLRLGAAIGLRDLAVKEKKKTLKLLVHDKSQAVRIAAYQAAYNIEEKSWEQIFIDGLKSQVPEIRVASLKWFNWLWFYDDEKNKKLYLNCLDDPYTALEALNALRRCRVDTGIASAVLSFQRQLAIHRWKISEELRSELIFLCSEVLRRQRTS